MVRRAVEASGRPRKSRDALTSRPEVERLLNAASAPASPRELAGEQAAVDLFHRARLVALSTPPGAEMHVARPARTGLKAAVAAAGAVGLLSTGVAFAASGGHAPWSHTTAGADTSTQTADHSHPTHPTHPTHPAQPTGGPTDESSQSTGPNAHGFVGLCRAYTSGNKAEHGKALESPAFQALVTAAGGSDNVATYCATLTPANSGHPTHPAKPTQAASPTHPTHPAKPTQAASPSKPAHPTHPAKPSKAASPTKPAHPTRDAHSSH